MAFQLQTFGGELDASQQIIPFEIGELSLQVLERVTRRQIFENRLDGITKSSNHRFAVANPGINRDACQ